MFSSTIFPLTYEVKKWHADHICSKPERLPVDFFRHSPFGRSLIYSSYPKNRETPSGLRTGHFDELGFPDGFCEVLKFGLPLLIHTEPTRTRRRNHESALASENLEFVRLTLDKWENMQVFRRTHDVPHIINSLSVISKEGKQRLVLDARSSGLNDCLLSPKFPLADIESIVSMTRSGAFLMKTDLASGFLQLPVNAEEQTYLGFIHPVDGSYCMMQRLSFGLASAPFLFQTFTQTVQTAAETILGVRTRVYIDDWFFTRTNEVMLKREFGSFTNLLDYLGILIQHPKTEGPTRSMTYLGLGINTEAHILFLPEEKRVKYLKGVVELLEDEQSTMAALTKTAGQLVHISAVHRAGAGHVQPFWDVLYADRSQWTRRELASEMFTMNDELVHCLQWWRRVLTQTSITRRIWVADDKRLYLWSHNTALRETYQARTVCTDASDEGWGACTDITTLAGTWTSAQKGNSINWRELKTVVIAITEWEWLRDVPILVLSDNVTTVAAIRSRASRAPPLRELAEELSCLEDLRKVEITAIHLPGKLNDLPDRLSRSMPIPTASMLTFNPMLLPAALRDAQQLVGLTWKSRRFDAVPFSRVAPAQQLGMLSTLIAVTTPDIPYLQILIGRLRQVTTTTWILLPKLPSSHLPMKHTLTLQTIEEGACIDAMETQWLLLEVRRN